MSRRAPRSVSKLVLDPASELLSKLVSYRTYNRTLVDQNRKESLDETIDRLICMHMDRFPSLVDEIAWAGNMMHEGKIMPSMRALQYGGTPILKNNIRQYNCSFLNIDDTRTFGELVFLLLSGAGVGFSVQNRHIKNLPSIRRPSENVTFIIHDSITGWAQAFQALFDCYFLTGVKPSFDYSLIREKGAWLKTTAARAPGPMPLRHALLAIDKLLNECVGRKLRSIEIYDAICISSDCVVSGGVRRAALICLFDRTDPDMITAKSGDWDKTHPYRARSNNSAVMPRDIIEYDEFSHIYDMCAMSGFGEPGLSWSNDTDTGWNPCIPAWSTVLTPAGIKMLKDVKIGDSIWSGKQWTTMTNKWSTGIKQVYAYHTTGGTFYGTENHRVVENGIKIEVKDAESIDTTFGPSPGKYNIDPQVVVDGLMIGDGTRHMLTNRTFLIISEDDQDYFESEIKNLIIDKVSWKDNNAHYIVKSNIAFDELNNIPDRNIPDRYRFGTPDVVCSFLRGLYSANGSICGRRVTLKSTNINIVTTTQEMLSSLGIRSYYTINKPSEIEWENGTYTSRESYDLNISTDRVKFMSMIGFIQKYKMDKLGRVCNDVKPGKNKVTFDIINTTLISTEEVFDITVDAEEHTFWNNGMLVSNCHEASLRSNTFCNLTTINQTTVVSLQDLIERARAAAFIGTLQASYTDFPYINNQWRVRTEEDALLGVSLTGIADRAISSEWMRAAAEHVVETNIKFAGRMGINPAARTNVLKPEGSSSCVLGTSSGMHSREGEFYIRRIQANNNDILLKYLLNVIPDLIEPAKGVMNTSVISIPQRSPKTALLKSSESAIDVFNRAIEYNLNWIKPGHRRGPNMHNVSCTIDVAADEWSSLKKVMWEKRNLYAGISMYPKDDSKYEQAPFEKCTEAQYETMLSQVQSIDLTQVPLDMNEVARESIACGGGACEVVTL